jgi:hypothetical protein
MGAESGARHGAAPAEQGTKPAGGYPGLWQAIAVALMSGAACLVWLLTALPRAAPAAQTEGSALAPVAAPDRNAALATLDDSADLAARIRADDARGCAMPLAVVTVVPDAGGKPTKIRLQSGAYFSPLFELSAEPVRIAIPYPADPASGHGVLRAVVTGGGATLALSPPWHLQPGDQAGAHMVRWTAGKACAGSHG